MACGSLSIITPHLSFILMFNYAERKNTCYGHGSKWFFAKNLIIKLKKEKVKILAMSSTILSNEYINLKYVKVKPWPSREIIHYHSQYL